MILGSIDEPSEPVIHVMSNRVSSGVRKTDALKSRAVVDLTEFPGLFDRLMRVNIFDFPSGYAEQDAPPRYEE